MVILMLGAQGTGKGTVAGILSKKTGWPQISTGDIFRKNISEKTELGIEANKYRGLRIHRNFLPLVLFFRFCIYDSGKYYIKIVLTTVI